MTNQVTTHWADAVWFKYRGDVNVCAMELVQRNVTNGGKTQTTWVDKYSDSTSQLYDNDGIHQVQTCVYDMEANEHVCSDWVNSGT
ncbi:hypothetical protein GCM10009839_88800 [Catenulispora yoronensis]|uniref:Uncharacterized protein n=1 Tax=Catenulispora yoronensis TaxID=450799 RepID=A0ABP5H2Z6_9ACTN